MAHRIPLALAWWVAWVVAGMTGSALAFLVVSPGWLP